MTCSWAGSGRRPSCVSTPMSRTARRSASTCRARSPTGSNRPEPDLVIPGTGYSGAVLAVAQFHEPLLLTNTIQRYDWGSVEAIPHLLGADPDGGPQAELWLGAHTSAPSVSVIED